MIGMNKHTGRKLEGADHLAQSIADILTTPLGSRIMRRDYGSLIPELIDQPHNAATTVRLYAATVSALMRWEPRLRALQLSLQRNGAGVILEIEGEVDGAASSIHVPLLLGGTS